MKKFILPLALISAGLSAQVNLIKDIRSGATGSSPSNTVVYNGQLIFKANDGTTGLEVWKSDGTSAGTALLADNNPGTGNYNPQYFTNFKGKLFFQALLADTGAEVFTYDGSNFSLFANLKAGNGSSVPQNFTPVGNTLFFKAQDPSSTISRLYKTDGSTAPTIVDANIGLGSGFGALGGTVFFAGSPTNAYQLYSSDGNTATLVQTINPSATASPANFYTSGSLLYFSATDGTNGKELWITDGTAAGTQMLKNINPTADSAPSEFFGFNGKVYFQANDGTNGNELWVTDGTAAGTVLLIDINSGSGNSNPANFAVYNGKLYFSANDGTNGIELWETDGTAANTKMTADINPGSGNSAPSDLVVLGNTLYFSADNGSTGKELYSYTPGTLGIAKAEKAAAGIYPNPTAGEIFMKNSEFSFELYSADGRLAEKGQSVGRKAFIKSPSGLYIIKISDKNGSTFSQKIIVKK